MDEPRALELMDEAIAEARKSVAEDNRPHLKVGAILAGPDGNILCRGHRGGQSGEGEHAEHVLFTRAADREIPFPQCTLFVTLEPCTRRSEEKIPCAVRVALSRVGCVYIGTLDPNPHITGRGELFLLSHTRVERFPYFKQQILFEINERFFEQHRHEHVPAVSLLIDPGVPSTLQLMLGGQREGILHQTMDLITGSKGDVWIMAGRLSWLRELQLALVFAAQHGRHVKILCSVPEDDPENFHKLKHIAAASGATVARASNPFSTRATLIAPDSGRAAMIAVEENPALHALILKAPHERGLLDAAARSFEYQFERADEIVEAQVPVWEERSLGQVFDALRRGVRWYADAELSFERLPLSDLRPLPMFLERFKLARLQLLAALRDYSNAPICAVLAGSPVVPPIFERRKDGTVVIIDGTHRAYSALERGEKEINGIVVDGVDAQLPARPQSDWSVARVTTQKLHRHQRYADFEMNFFRPVRAALSRLGEITT